jgi:SAM-dependent methyltransferase
MSDMKTEVPAATAFTHWGTCPEPAMATFAARRFPQRDALFLDVGCGAGAQTTWLLSEGFSVRSIDVSPQAINATDASVHQFWRDDMDVVCSVADVCGGEAMRRHCRDNAFDAAIDVCCLQHLDHDQVRKALAEIYRVLKPRGWLFSMTANLNHDETAAGGHYLRREDWFSVQRLYERAGFPGPKVTEQFHTYTGRSIGHWIVEAQKP